jgi:hypothetical protein
MPIFHEALEPVILCVSTLVLCLDNGYVTSPIVEVASPFLFFSHTLLLSLITSTPLSLVIVSKYYPQVSNWLPLELPDIDIRSPHPPFANLVSCRIR